MVTRIKCEYCNQTADGDTQVQCEGCGAGLPETYKPEKSYGYNSFTTQFIPMGPTAASRLPDLVACTTAAF